MTPPKPSTQTAPNWTKVSLYLAMFGITLLFSAALTSEILVNRPDSWTTGYNTCINVCNKELATCYHTTSQNGPTLNWTPSPPT